MSKPIIGIVGSVSLCGSDCELGSDNIKLNYDYIDAISKAGGVPIVLPVVKDNESLIYQLKYCDGILISDGQDINPIFYNEDPHMFLGENIPKLDVYQLKLCKLAISQDKPILGICRGHQLINVACGGNLYQDLSLFSNEALQHFHHNRRYDYCHSINIEQDSILGQIYPSQILVNSHHHQSVKELGKNIRVIASSKDRVVESIQMDNKKFILGIQWNPEILLSNNDEMLPLFRKFVQSCVK